MGPAQVDHVRTAGADRWLVGLTGLGMVGQIADDFIMRVTHSGCLLAEHRNSTTLCTQVVHCQNLYTHTRCTRY